MLCRRSGPPRADYLLVALKAMRVATTLIEFLDEGKSIPVVNREDPQDIFLWAVWMLKGDVWDLEFEGLSYEDRKFLESALARIESKPSVGSGGLFLPRSGRWNLARRTAVAESLLEFFSALQAIANGATGRERRSNF